MQCLCEKALTSRLRAHSITTCKEFLARSHYLIAETGWEEVADYSLTWAENPK